jgi:hypothetical protein
MRMAKVSVGVLSAVTALALVVGGADAKPLYIKKAQAAGHKDVKNCAHCHTEKKPIKELNPVGQWLHKQKETKKAQEVDLTWLKDYSPSK